MVNKKILRALSVMCLMIALSALVVLLWRMGFVMGEKGTLLGHHLMFAIDNWWLIALMIISSIIAVHLETKI